LGVKADGIVGPKTPSGEKQVKYVYTHDENRDMYVWVNKKKTDYDI
jgi:hypothetical protein